MYFIVPTPFVQIIIFNEELYFDNEALGNDTFGNETLGNLTIGDPLTLDCTVTAVRGISSSVDIIWTTGGRVVRRADKITADIEQSDSTIYTDSFEISSLSAIDNGREYQCTVVINASQPVYSSDHITLNFPGEYNLQGDKLFVLLVIKHRKIYHCMLIVCLINMATHNYICYSLLLL